MLKKYLIIYLQILFYPLMSVNNNDSSFSKKSINMKIDFSTNNIFGYIKDYMSYRDKGFYDINYFYFVLEPQFNYYKFKTKKVVILGTCLGIGREFMRLRNKSASNYFYLYNNYDDILKKKTLEIHFIRLGISYISILKNNLCYGFDFNLRRNIYFSELEGRYMTGFGLITALTNGSINLDCSLSFNIGYKMKDNIFLFHITSPQYFEQEYFSIGFKYLRRIFYVKKRN
jgi:hypothetical protein